MGGGGYLSCYVMFYLIRSNVIFRVTLFVVFLIDVEFVPLPFP